MEMERTGSKPKPVPPQMRRFFLLFFIWLFFGTGWGAVIRHAPLQYNDVTNPDNDDSLILSHWVNHLNANSFFIEPDKETFDTLRGRYPGIRALAYLSFSTMYNRKAYQSTDTGLNVFNREALTDVNRDSIMRAWAVSKSLTLYQRQDMFLHWKYNVRQALRFVPTTRFHFEAWADANDANSNGVRDKIGYFNTATRTGLNYLVSSEITGVNTTGMGVYRNVGLGIVLIDTVKGQSGDSAWWDVGDTTNLTVNAGFELPSDSAWLAFGGGTNQNFTGALKIFGDSSRVIVNDADGSVQLRQPKTARYYCTSGEEMRFKFYFRSNNNVAKFWIARGDEFGYGMIEYQIPSDSADMAIHRAIVTGTVDRDSFIIGAGFPVGTDPTDTLIIDSIVVIKTKGYLASDSQFVIDSLSGVSVHYATALYESLATARDYEIQRELLNVGDTNYRKFMKGYTVDYCSTYRATPNLKRYSGIMLDEWQAFVPQDARYKTKEYDTTVAGDTVFYANYKSTVDYVNDTTASRNLLIVANRQNDTTVLRLCDGQYAEGIGTWELPIAPNKDSMWIGTGYWGLGAYAYPGYNYQFYKNNILRYKQALQTFPNKKHIYEYQDGVLLKESDDTGQAKITALAQYLILAKPYSDSTWFFFKIGSQYEAYNHYWDVWWDYAIGTPVDTPYVVQSGTAGGFTYIAVGQKYVTPLLDTLFALYVPRPDTAVLLSDTVTVKVSLGSTYSQFNSGLIPGQLADTAYIGFNRGWIGLRCKCR